MPSNLYQLEVSYNQIQDRLLLKIYTQDLAEYRFWMTRYFLKGLWGVLNTLLECDAKGSVEHAKEKQEIEKRYSREQAERRPIANKYGTKLTKTPLGDEPLLLLGVVADVAETGALIIKFQVEKEKTIEISANSKTIISLQKLLAETARRADWKLE